MIPLSFEDRHTNLYYSLDHRQMNSRKETIIAQQAILSLKSDLFQIIDTS